MVDSEYIKESQAIENKITQHFLYLHGVLQNVEEQLKNKLLKRRTDLQKEIENFRNTLSSQEEKLMYARAVINTVETNFNRINLKKIMDLLMELVNLPCHVIQICNYNESVRMEIDESVFDSIKQHIQVHVPDGQRFNLAKTDELPENYELEPLPATEAMNLCIKMNDLRMNASSSTLSTKSQHSSNQSINEFYSEEPGSLLKGTKELVKVTCINNPTDFYVQRLSTNRWLKEIESDIAKYVEKNQTPPEEIILNRIYIVENSAELKWCRGRVISSDKTLNDEVIYKVFFIDYGFNETGVTLDRIRGPVLHFNLCVSLAVHCTLKPEIAPMNGEWEDGVIEQFKNMITDCTLIMHVLQATDPYVIDLRRFNDNRNNLSIYDWLVDTKLAKPTSYFKLKRMNPLSAQQFYYEDLFVEKYTKVDVSYVESPNCIYVKKKMNNKDSQEIVKTFYKQYETFLKKTDASVKNPEYEDAVALKIMGKWERGIIVNIFSTKSEVRVFLIDRGDSVNVHYSKIFRLPNRFCFWNAQAIKVSLVDIIPANGAQCWSTEVIAYLKQVIEGRSVRVFPFSKTEDAYDVCIYVDKDINLNANLVSMNYAESIGNHSKHVSLNRDITVVKKQRKKTVKKYKALGPINENDISSNITPVKIVEDSDPFKVRVIINKINTPDEIYVSQAYNVDYFEKMGTDMQQFYESNEYKWERELQPNAYYCVYSRKDKQFCRAQFLSMSDSKENLAKMMLIDLAEIEEIAVENIQPLNRRFMNVPINMFKIKLAGIRPCGGSTVWQSTTCQRLKEIISDTEDTKCYITLIDSFESDGTMPVDLIIRRNVVTGPIEPNRKETLSVARCLVESGVALPIRGHVQSNGKALAIELKKKLRLSNVDIQNSTQLVNNKVKVSEEESTQNVTSNEVENGKIDENEDTTEIPPEDISSESIPLPPKLSEWIPPAHLRDDMFNASITYVDYDCNVHFHPDTPEYNDTIEYINNTLHKHYNNRSIKKYDHHWQKGDLCIANYHYDRKWYRGVVIEVTNHQVIKVLFVDYGNAEECQVGAIKKRIILDHIPIQCIKASVVGIKPLNNKWKTSDLDIIHKAIVNPKKCRMRLVSKPPNPWKVAVWIIEDQSSYSLGWYLNNKTQVRCIAEDINQYYDNNFIASYNSPQIINEFDDLNKLVPVLTINNCNDSHFSSGNEDRESDEEDYESNSDDVSTLSNENEDKGSNSLRSSCQKTLNTAPQIKCDNSSIMVHNGLSNNSIQEETLKLESKSTLISSNSLLQNIIAKGKNEKDNIAKTCNGIVNKKSDYCNISSVDEKLISSSFNNCVNDAFEIESVKSEFFNENLNGLVASTSLSNFSEDDSNENENFQYIDFHRYNIISFEITIEVMLSETEMTAHITSSENEIITQWISSYNNLQNELQNSAENQPIYDIGSDKSCIAKFFDGQWYRARILNNSYDNDDQDIEIEFVDFGNRMKISDKKCIRTMKKEWSDLPWMSFNFKLYNVKIVPQNKNQVESAIEKVFDLSNKYHAVIKKYDPIIELELYLDKDHKLLAYASLLENNIFEIIDTDLE